MKKLLLMCALSVLFFNVSAQNDTAKVVKFNPRNVEKYDVKVYQNKTVAQSLSAKWAAQAEALSSNSRGAFFDGLFAASKTAATGLMSQSLPALASSTFSAVLSNVKSKKSRWKAVVEKENRYTKKIMMLENMDDFYSNVSDAGALDPSGLSFNGFSCFQQRGKDTILFIVCHLDTTENGIKRILHHSKFELQLDTLIFNPQLCNLPNDSARSFSERKPYSFADRGNLFLDIHLDVTSSWINQAIQIYRDIKLGEFSIKAPISEDALDSDGVFRFINGKSQYQDCQITGECFIVPRSYIGVRDMQGIYHDAWGTGQYKITMTISESCSLTPEFVENWKADWKSRPKSSSVSKDVMLSMKQTWDKNSSAWINSVTEAPMSYTKSQVMSALGISLNNPPKK